MAKGVGLDAGEYEVKVVELDGSYRKPRLSKVRIDRVAPHAVSASDPDHAASEANALKNALKNASISKQNICLGFPSREALFRRMQVPFTGEERIRKVIKFEAESEIHSQSVDDMVIDFLTVEERDDETRVLVAGVPKAPLRTTLLALESAGIEPERVDLDCMGLFRIAHWAGVLAEGDVPVAAGGDEGEDGEVDVAPAIIEEGAESRVVLDIGARSVLVLIVTGGQLTDMRAIPLGCDSMADELASRLDIDLDSARSAVEHCLIHGTDWTAADPEEDEEGEEAESSLPATSMLVDVATVEAARDRFVQRLRREFMRFMVSVKGMGRVQAVFTTGAGSQLHALQDMLGEVFSAEPQPLEYMHLLQHNLSEEEVEDHEPRIAVALGLALGNMGGGKGFNFRQEDLVFTRGFERIKLPLAIACMLLLFFLFFHGVGLQKQLRHKEMLYGAEYAQKASKAAKGRVAGGRVTDYFQFTGELGRIANQQFFAKKTMTHTEYRKMVNRLADRPTFERLPAYRIEMQKYLSEIQKKGEYQPSLALESGSAVLQQFAGLLTRTEKALGAFYIKSIQLSLPPKKSGRYLNFSIFFRGPQFRERNAELDRVLREQFRKPDSPIVGYTKPPKEAPFSGASEVGLSCEYFLELRPELKVQKIPAQKPY